MAESGIQWRSSGAKAPEFARLHGLKASNLYYWSSVLGCAHRPIVDARIGALWTPGSGHCGQRDRPRGHRNRGIVDAEIAVVDGEIGIVNAEIGSVDSVLGRSRVCERITFEAVT